MFYRKLLLLFLLCFMLGSCQKQEWQLHDIGGHMPDLAFSLTEDHGREVTAKDYRGIVTLVYFGFTGCSNQCPLVMTRLTAMLKQLGPVADQIKILFVSVDPIHDMPQTLQHYIAAFDPHHMVGLTGNDRDIIALAKRYRIAIEIKPNDNTVHSNSVYIFDRGGHARLILTPDDSDGAFIHDLAQLAS